VPGNERDTGAVFREYDLAAARKLLAEAGFADGKGLPTLTVSYDTSPDTRLAFDFLKARFAAAGVRLKAVFTDNATTIRNLETGNFQMVSNNWMGDPDASDFYQQLYSKNIGTGSNLTGFSHSAYDRAYEASHFMPNGPERYRLFKVMNDILRDEVPMIFTVNSVRVGLKQKWLSNFKRNELGAEYMYVDVDMAMKKKGLP
jgi:ABC-type transport system substrate-binding protein